MRVNVVSNPDGSIVSLTVITAVPESPLLRRAVPNVDGDQVMNELELPDKLTRCRLVDIVQDYRLELTGKRAELVPWNNER